MNHILIINGPNLNLLGKRQPEIYGSLSFDDYFSQLKNRVPEASLEYFQSNEEGALINRVQQTDPQTHLGIVLNAGAYAHTSIALADAVAAIHTPVVEVHISNVFAREPFRRHSYLSPVCKGLICGLGLEGYYLAIRWLINPE